MTLLQASERFCIDREKLQSYEKNGLFDCRRRPDGTIDYCDETLEYVSLIDLLLKAGLDMDTLKAYFCGPDGGASKKERISILMKQRYALLDDIHDKEKILNRLDYVIHEAKKEP